MGSLLIINSGFVGSARGGPDAAEKRCWAGEQERLSLSFSPVTERRAPGLLYLDGQGRQCTVKPELSTVQAVLASPSLSHPKVRTTKDGCG